MAIAAILCLLPFLTYSQTNKPVLLAEINQQLWIPFLEGVNKGKDELYIDIHSKDFYWVMGGSKPRIMNFKEYEDDSRMVMQKRKKEDATTHLDVRFLERIVNNEFAAEKCVFAYTLQEKNKNSQTFYSIAQIFSRKENGKWKMLVQSVSTEKATIDTFQGAEALEKGE